MQTSLRALVVSVIAITMLGLPVLPDAALRPMQIDQRAISLAFAEESGGAWVSDEIEGDSTIAGLTWDDVEIAPESAEVRILVDGTWSGWQNVEVDDEHAPDPDSDEADGSRGSTAPIVVEGADAIQFRVADHDGPPTGLTAELIDIDDPDGTKRVQDRTSAADAAPTRPRIHPRSAWGGDDCPARRTELISYSNKVEVVFVHHTTGHTSYPQSRVPSIIRGICEYHVGGNNWSDIGYNALIDQYGGIWEGRAGGLEKGVIGAHTGGFNSYSTGVALIGDHRPGYNGAPTRAAQDALIRYAAWKMDVHNINPLGEVTLTSGGSSKYKKGAPVTLNTLSGHSDASSTSCPGSSCYEMLGHFRTQVDALGGFRIFGGRAQAETMAARADGSWEPPTFTFSFSEPANWVFLLRDGDGRELLRRTGSGSSSSVTWDATTGGQAAEKGEYTTHVTATRRSDGARATQADNTFFLGGALGEFDDVPNDNPFHGDISWLSTSGITKGCNPPENTRYCPTSPVTRGQMAAFLDRALTLAPGRTGTFTDVPSSHVFAQDIADLARAEITKGCNPPDNTKYCPGSNVTRQEMAAFLVRALELTSNTHRGFNDVPASSTFASDIGRLATAEITIGCNPPNNTKFCPTEPVTRQQMAAFLHRALAK